MIVGVTGGFGFIGSYVRKELLRKGHEVVVFDRHNKQGTLDPGEQFFLGDVRDETSVFELAAHVDGIIHLAAVLGTAETIQAPVPAMMTNIVGSLNIFEAANRYGLPVAYAGVGNHFMRLEGGGSYTISKSAAEDYARMYNSYRSGKITIVRPVNAYGPGQSIAEPYGSSKVRKIIPSFVCRALTGEDIEVYGDGEQISDCVYVGDVARVFVRALEVTEIFGERIAKPIEVGPDRHVTVNEIANFVAERATYPYKPVNVRHLPMRPGEVPGAVVTADVETLEVLGREYEADTFVSLEEGLDVTIGWYRDNWLNSYKKVDTKVHPDTPECSNHEDF